MYMWVTVSTPTRAPFTNMLGEREGKVARHLLGGHAPSIAKAVMAMDDVRESLFSLFLDAINEECNNLCRRSPTNSSLFRKMPLSQIVDFKWSALVSELESRAPLLFKALSSIAAHSDNRNKSKVGVAHHPGICMAVAIILKERNREMCGVQSVASLLMYSYHCEKKVWSVKIIPQCMCCVVLCMCVCVVVGKRGLGTTSVSRPHSGD